MRSACLSSGTPVRLGVLRSHSGAYSTSLLTLSLLAAAYAPMIDVPHDQPSRLIFATPRRLRMNSAAVATSRTATPVVTIGGLSCGGWSISEGRVESP